MRLFGKIVSIGDSVYSESMGYGLVSSITGRSIVVVHHGELWRYSLSFVRQGCKKTDLGWRPRHTGNQIKNSKSGDNADRVIDSLAKSLREFYG